MSRRSERPARTRAAAHRRSVTSALIGVVVAGSGAACSSEESPPEASEETPAASAPASPEVPPIATTATIGTVTGALPAPQRRALVKRVTTAVDAWIDAAYVDGDYPRSDFGDAFDSFTAGAAQRARTDRALMSNASVGKRVDDVRVTRRQLRIDVLASDDRAAGVTARFNLQMSLSGDLERRDRVSGSLFMTYHDGAWKVFGYDVDRGEA